MNGDIRMRTLPKFLLCFLCVMSTAAVAQESRTYFVTDVVGSPVIATDDSGNVTWEEDYLPYGERRYESANADSNDRWFTNAPQNSDSGLVDLGNRMYDPIVGRFYGIDPVGVSGSNTFSMNKYAYANNNPYKFIDPNGLDAFLVSRPLSGDSKHFSHNFIVHDADFIGDKEALVASFGRTPKNGGKTGRVTDFTTGVTDFITGFSEGTSAADREFWENLSADSNGQNDYVTKINATDEVVKNLVETLNENTNYHAVWSSFKFGTNSNSAAAAIANRAQRSEVAEPDPQRRSPGAEAWRSIEFANSVNDVIRND